MAPSPTSLSTKCHECFHWKTSTNIILAEIDATIASRRDLLFKEVHVSRGPNDTEGIGNTVWFIEKNANDMTSKYVTCYKQLIPE